MNFSIVKQGWSLLDRREKKQAVFVLSVVIVSAISSAAMVGSVMPFLAALASPDRIHTVPIFAQLYRAGGFRSDYGFLIALGIASLLVIIVVNLAQLLRVYLVVKFSTMRMHTLSRRLLSVYMRQPYAYFLDKNSGDLGSQILAETYQVVQNFFRPAAEATASALTIIAIASLMLWVNPLVAATSFLVSGGIYIGAYAITQKMVAAQGMARTTANRTRFRLANEALGGIKDAKLLGREQNYVAAFSGSSLDVAVADIKVGVIGQLPQYVMQMVAFGGMIVLSLALLKPSELHSGNSLASVLPLLGVFAFAGQRLIPELSRLYQGITQLNYGSSIVQSLYKDLNSEGVLPPLPCPDTVPMGLRRELQLHNVTYHYPNTEKPSLRRVSVTVRAGERIGVVGVSGSGKTTLADIMMGLLQIDSGKFLVDGFEVTEANIVAWQRSVSYVQQDIFLSDASILENIALGLPRSMIDRPRAEAAARMARLDRFVRQSLPMGYDTVVGERGVRLSGGQKQRIGIARALYNQADLIVFDEATSALDNVTEKQVMDSIDGLPKNTTVILIAHRLSTVASCDRLIILDQGTVVGAGSWAELMRSNMHFKRLASLQQESTKRSGGAS
jgi:ABC-type bacteriocin/lantibiotic exporter with double-glycine peptidase domain